MSRVHSLKLLDGFYFTSLKTSSISSSRTPSTIASTTASATRSTTPLTTSSSTLSSTSLNPLVPPFKTVATTIISSLNPSTPPSKTIVNTIVNPNAITSSPTPYYPAPPSILSTPTVAGIGLGAGLFTSGAIAGIAICLWRKRKRARASPDGQNQDIGNSAIFGGTGPMVAQTNNNTAQGYQNAPHPGSLYDPKSQPPDFMKVPEQTASPPNYSPVPIYTSGQHTSPPLIPYDSNNRTSTMSQYSSPAPTTLPLLSKSSANVPAELHQQQASATTSSRDYTPNSPVSELGLGEAAMGNFSRPRNHAHEVTGVVPTYFNNAGSSAQPLQSIHEALNQVEPRYEAYNPMADAQRSSTACPTPTHTQAQTHVVGGQLSPSGEGSLVIQPPPQQRGGEAGARPVEML